MKPFANNQDTTVNECFAVIDTETSWQDKVISIGVVIAQKNYHIVAEAYYIITPECELPAIYEDALYYYNKCVKCERSEAISEVRGLLQSYHVENIFAYNASFDYNHLPEMRDFVWHDIMRMAAYRQYNPNIPKDAECWATGKLKSGFGVESIMRMLTGDKWYYETHNAVIDAIDELTIMALLGYAPEQYPNIYEKMASVLKAQKQREKNELCRKKLQEYLSQGNIDVINFECKNEPVTIRCRQCMQSWEVCYYDVNSKRPKCPNCFPKVKPRATNKK